MKQNDYIYIVYRKNESIDDGSDTGYLLIPETTAISIEAVDGTDYTFERDASLDIKEAGASLKVGSNFSVDTDGKIYTKAGEIGALKLTPTTLGVGSGFSDSSDNGFLHINTDKNYAPTG